MAPETDGRRYLAHHPAARARCKMGRKMQGPSARAAVPRVRRIALIAGRATGSRYGMAYPCLGASDRWRRVSGTFDTTIHLRAWARVIPLMGMTTAFPRYRQKYSVSVIPNRTC